MDIDEDTQVSRERRKDEIVRLIRFNRLSRTKRLKLNLRGSNRFRIILSPAL
ncbi:MAG: hypothetical protein Kow0074_25550 [Candidatus Zixiibacteriota bacterium]